MTSTPNGARMRLHRLAVVHESDPDWPLEAEPLLPGVLEVTAGPYVHLLFCPDVVTLVTSLWNRQPYGARRQMLRPVLSPAAGGSPATVQLEAVWADGSALLLEVPLAAWHRQVSRLAGQAADVLTGAGEQGLILLLAPALAGATEPAR